MASAQKEASNNQDEIFIQQTLQFSDTLRDLKNLRKQLYSAAEYFEVSYRKEDQNHMVVEALKEYAIKALVNTVDHLGSVAYKVNNFFDEKISEITVTSLRLSCIEQRVRASEVYINKAAISQQLLVIETPKHHKRYIFPEKEMDQKNSECYCRSFRIEDDQFRSAVRETMTKTPSPAVREGYSKLKPPRSASRPETFSFTQSSRSRTPEKRASSPNRFPFMRSGSLLKRSPSPNYSRQQYNAGPRRSVSLSAYAERELVKDIEQHSKKSKRFFKALMSVGRTRKDGTL